MPGTSFDRVASIYDATRGGTRRGDAFADAIAPLVAGSAVVELGIGTGVIARGLARHSIDVVGVDLSAAMLRSAVDRIGHRVAVADVDRLPVPDDSATTAYLVWVLQLVEDPIATIAEAARIVRPGGRVIAILSSADPHPTDEIGHIVAGLDALHARRPSADSLTERTIAGLRIVHQGFTPWDTFPGRPADQIANIEGRIYSSLFDVDDATWAAVVEPVLVQLRALPDPDRPRERRNRHPLLVWEVAHQ